MPFRVLYSIMVYHACLLKMINPNSIPTKISLSQKIVEAWFALSTFFCEWFGVGKIFHNGVLGFIPSVR
jgi:hypothetical protein